jgi:cytochrome c-type biogenesis protein CcmH
MMVFWSVAGLMTLGALLFIVLPLLGGKSPKVSARRSEVNLSIYRDQLHELDTDLTAGTLSQAQYQSARSELERRILEDSSTNELPEGTGPGLQKWVIAAVIAVPLLTVTLYFLLGKLEGVDTTRKEAVAQPQVSQVQIETMVKGLVQKLEAKPDDAEGWAMLGRSYATLRRFNESSTAYARAAALSPDNAVVLTEYADVLAMTNGRSMVGGPEKIILQALQADPKNVKALALAGTAAFQGKDYRHAIEWWQKILPLVPQDSSVARSVNANISQAQGLAGLPLSVTGQDGNKHAKSNLKVSGMIMLEPALKARVAEDDTVFIFARDADAQRPPLAILRKTVKDLPVTFTLDDSMAAMPNFKLSSATNLVVGARISKSGNAMPSPGDWQGFSQPVKMGSSGITVTINAEVK